MTHTHIRLTVKTIAREQRGCQGTERDVCFHVRELLAGGWASDPAVVETRTVRRNAEFRERSLFRPSFDMKIDRPLADGATAGKGKANAAAGSDERSGVFRSADADGSEQGRAAADDEFIHGVRGSEFAF